MGDLVQFVAGGSSEVGIQSQYLDGELHFVDDALAGAVAAGEKFEVFNSIVSPNAIDVVDGFVRKQFASDMFGHNVAVFHNMPLPVLALGQFGDVEPNIAVTFCMFFVSASFKFMKRFFLLPFYFAGVSAVLLLLVKSASRFAAFVIYFAACQAGKCVARFACFSAAYSRALSRAVPRISSIFFMVRGDKVLHHRKSLAAFATSEIYGRSPLGWNAFVEAVSASTRKTAVFPVFARETGKRLLAIFTDFLNRHRLAPLFGDEGTLSMSIGSVK